MLQEEHDQQGDGEHGEERSDKGHLGDERRVLAVTQAEDGAVGGHGHGNDHRVDAHHKGREVQGSTQIMHAQGQQGQTHEGGGVDGTVAQHGSQRQVRHTGADDEQGRRHGDVAYHGEGLADEGGNVVYLYGHDEHGEIGREHGRAVKYLLLETRAFHFALARDEHSADGEDGKRVDYVEYGGIEHRLVAEDGRHDGIAHEPHVAKHQGKANDTFIVRFLHQIAGQHQGDARKHNVGNHADAQKREDIAAVGQLASHGRGKDQSRTGDVDDQLGQPLVESAAHISQLASRVTHDDDGKERYHYCECHAA